MIAILLSAMFVGTGLLAIASICESCRRHGPAALALRDELRRCEEWREIRITIREITVRPQGAAILRPEFKVREHSRAAEHALPVAA